MSCGRTLGVMVVLIIALLGCATYPKQPDFSSLSNNQHPTTPAQNGVIQTALSLLGTPYRFGGTTPQGFDCTGFINYVYRHSVGLVLPRVSHSLIRAGKPISAADLQPADLVYFKIERQKPLHAGIYIGNGKFIHAPSSKGRVNIQSLGMDYWRERFIAARRVI